MATVITSILPFLAMFGLIRLVVWSHKQQNRGAN